jgi:hypothetical protein
MKGIIFNMLEQFIIETADIDTYEEILDECQFSTAEPFIGPGTYPDADLMQIVGKTVEKLQIPLPDVLHWRSKCPSGSPNSTIPSPFS